MDPAWRRPDFGVVVAEAGVQRVPGTASMVGDAQWVMVASRGAVAVLGRRLCGKDNSILVLLLFNLHPLPSPLP